MYQRLCIFQKKGSLCYQTILSTMSGQTGHRRMQIVVMSIAAMRSMTKEFKMEIKHKTPLDTIRAYCVSCNDGNDAEVRRCDADGKTKGYTACLFHRYRMGKGRPSVKIIRKFCLECMGNNRTLVSECETVDCLCYPYRMGKNPARKGKGGRDRVELALMSARKQSIQQLQQSIP